MAIKAAQLIHVANQILVDRAQTAGPGTVNLNRQKVYELGNYLTVGSITDIPDLSFSLESFDASAALEATLCGLTFEAANGIQTVTVGGAPTGGTFTLSFAGQTSSALAYNASAAAVQTALRALSSVPASTLSVAGNAGGPYTVSLSGSLTSGGTAALLTGDATSLTGGTSPSVTVAGSNSVVMADGTAMRLDQAFPLDVASEFKAGINATQPFNTVGGVAVPYLALESLSYKYGLTNNAAQTATLKGDGLYYTPGSVFIDEFVGTGVANQSITLGNLVYPYNGDIVAGTKYALSVSLSTGQRLSINADYTESAVGAGPTKTVTLTILAAVPNTASIKVVYGSDTVRSFPQSLNTPVSPIRPSAIRGRHITACIGGVQVTDRWTSVQSVQIDWKVSLQRDEEFGNSSIVAQDFDVPDVSGNLGLKPRSYAELYNKICTIANVTPGEVAGALSTAPMPLYVALHSPDTGAVLKSFYVPDARFNLPGFSGRVQQKLELQLDWMSDTGLMTVYKGAMPGALG